jgi:hypothetical protein
MKRFERHFVRKTTTGIIMSAALGIALPGVAGAG